MTRLKRAAIVTALADALRDQGSWSGETHLQKATYLMQEMLGVPLEYDYVLYKHGPYSFDLHDELAEMRADDILEVISQHPPYGPKLESGEGAEQLRERFPNTLRKYERQVGFIAETLGNEGVIELEKLATGYWVKLNEGGSAEAQAQTLHELKPHISVAEAERALERVEEMEQAAPVFVA